MGYLISKFKGIYRLKAPYDLRTHQYPTTLNGTYEDVDVYIDCYKNTKIFYYGKGILQAYIPSLIRGRNIIKQLKKIKDNLIFDIEESSEEVMFKFHYSNHEEIIPLLQPKTSGASISPYSTRNLPKNKDYKIPDEELSLYKDIINLLPKKRILNLTHRTNDFVRTLVNKRRTYDDIKADMALKGLKGKEYIHSIGKWKEYIKYLNENLDFSEGE